MRCFRTDLRIAGAAAGRLTMVKHQRSSAGRGGRSMSGKEAVRTYKRLAKRWQARAARRPTSSRLLLAKWRDDMCEDLQERP